MAKAWYGYIQGNPLSPESYYRITVQPEFGPGMRLSAVYAKDNGGVYPDSFSSKLKTHITNALTSGASQFDENEQLVVSMNH
jgi:hypothetical protein